MAFDSSTNCSSWLALMNSMDGAPMSTPDAASMTLATRPAVSTVSTTPSRSAAAIIGNASWILVPPRMKTQGRAGSSRRRARLAYSFSNSRPMADGSSCSKPTRVGCERCAAAKASQT